jgi:hypothetical protein
MRPVGVLAAVVLVVACGPPTAPRPPAPRRSDAAAIKDAAAARDGAPVKDGPPAAPESGSNIGTLLPPALPATDAATSDGAENARCSPVSRACLGDTLVACDSEGKSSSTDCPQGCNLTTLLCNQCRPNERTCTGTTQAVCRPDGTGSDSLPCMNGCNTPVGECNGCTPGTSWCNGDTLRECTAAGEQRDKQTCPSGCDGTRNACNACKPGARSCSGDNLIVCKADGSASTTSNCGEGCNNERKACNRCRPNSRQCNGLTTQVCKADGTGFTDVGGGDCKKSLGQGCGGNGECASNFCARGLCCNTACDGVCLSCVGSENGGTSGTCGPARTDTDPRDECPTSPPASCGTDGLCDGAGRCRLYGSGTECAPGTCGAGREVGASHCDGQNHCQPSAPHDCAPFVCGATSCLQACGRDQDCSAGLSCRNSKCGGVTADLGTSCTTGSQCGSGFCTDGVCCVSSSCDACRRCNAQGTCEGFAPRNQPDDGCTAPNVCNGSGRCGACPGVQCEPASCQRETLQCLALASIFPAPCEPDACGHQAAGCRGKVESLKLASGSDAEPSCTGSDLVARTCASAEVVAALRDQKTVTVELFLVGYDKDGKPVPGTRRSLGRQPCPM